MRNAWLTHMLPVITTAAICIGSMIWLGIPAARATDSALPQQDALTPKMTSRATTPGPATLPLRWRVAYARQTAASGADGTYCGTAVVVWNTTPAAVDVQVEYFMPSGLIGVPDSVGYAELSLPANSPRVWWTSDAPKLSPINLDGVIVGLGDHSGVATVHASDPRIITSAYLVCRPDNLGTTGANVGLLNIPTFPVGATVEYFQAGMPAAWTSPMAVPE